ncbi:MAG TPA: NAD(P)H-hydrate dehydratase [Phycisphaerae bacterium]|jgi:ADP-dependent NAD(P)H-hydrate dehydratase|nr:NAD(P)H-hydrate dehydratase [Phycisphaerae bacterium]HOJ56245.1 NAD(P)H-hydrate dehydratase [Phycisphaerae bacterium]HOL27847.1 NAD(P)H-hydrate dehydratase [Phycisphaerae bacterium]HPP19671.1 NAD(P)H-hydrate dehydratase [Phycisphaerae bacterium]HPU31587.1 NAD(P)H-hydrate dehydratase [Phycisphaerae bacterium]
MATRREKNPGPRRVRAVPPVPKRATDAHKGNFGRILVLGGSVGMAGAPSLTGQAALRGGAGLVVIAVPVSIQATVAGLCPCATTIGLPETRGGQIDPAGARRVLEQRGLLDTGQTGRAPDVLVVGPGVGLGPQAYAVAFWKLIDVFRHELRVPCVADADALNLAKETVWPATGEPDTQYHSRTIITPHPGEMARLQGVGTREVQADREGFAVRTARRMAGGGGGGDDRPVVVLKGAGTIVTDGERIYVNRTGNPGMATGGSGDVLAGLIGALVGQGMKMFDAAVTGVYLHGLAGDVAAKRVGQVSLIATDIIDALPEAFRRFAARR